MIERMSWANKIPAIQMMREVQKIKNEQKMKDRREDVEICLVRYDGSNKGRYIDIKI